MRSFLLFLSGERKRRDRNAADRRREINRDDIGRWFIVVGRGFSRFLARRRRRRRKSKGDVAELFVTNTPVNGADRHVARPRRFFRCNFSPTLFFHDRHFLGDTNNYFENRLSSNRSNRIDNRSTCSLYKLHVIKTKEYIYIDDTRRYRIIRDFWIRNCTDPLSKRAWQTRTVARCRASGYEQIAAVAVTRGRTPWTITSRMRRHCGRRPRPFCTVSHSRFGTLPSI